MGKRRKHYSKKALEKEISVLRELLEWIIYIIVVMILSFLAVTYVGQRTRVDGHSMETTLYDGDNLWVDKLSYRFRDPKRYEIVVFPFKYKENTYYIKRIIGLPGETVQVKDGYVYIDGEKSDEHYGNEMMVDTGIAAVWNFFREAANNARGDVSEWAVASTLATTTPSESIRKAIPKCRRKNALNAEDVSRPVRKR